MFKLLISMCVVVSILFAGQLYFGPATALDREFTEYWVDTLTIKPAAGIKTISFGNKPLYNMRVIPLNAAGDSAGAKLWTDHFGHSFFRNDTLSWSKHPIYLGITSAGAQARDTLNLHVPVEWIKILSVKGGTADSAFLFLIEGYR